MRNKYFRIFALLLMGIYNICTYADEYKCNYEITPDGQLRIIAVYNYYPDRNITVFIDGSNQQANCGTIAANGGSLNINRYCKKFVKIAVQGGDMFTIMDAESTIANWKKNQQENLDRLNVTLTEEQPSYTPSTHRTNNVSGKTIKPLQAADVIAAFSAHIDTTVYYSNAYMQTMNAEIDKYIKALQYMKQESKEAYIKEEQLNGYVTDAQKNLQQHKNDVEAFIYEFLINNYPNVNINDKQTCLNEMHKILSGKLTEREDAIARLNDAMSNGEVTAWFNELTNNKSMLLNIATGIIILIVLIFITYRIRKHHQSRRPTVIPEDKIQQNAQADIVVRRKTTSILKKQSLEDVHNNPAYMKIDCIDFCDNSAVRRIYFKNSCIKEIYNMYAEDLRNPENPNEDGCMVLGRWVYDKEKDEYYISLEEIVKPGDDAVFKEFELNFGGKIKLKVSEKLRKLRRETNLQYDMTCWVHSHPGLGVFFSNPDSNVQMQLKHPTHPRFLTAIVIDILTPNQELGIFTFKHDMTINSRPELKKLYSLEEMYRWAVESDRSSFKPEDYYNIMLSASNRINQCYDIALSNSAIIDMCQMESEQQIGLTGWVHGYSCQNDKRNSYVILSVSKEETMADNENLGFFIIGTHRSLPTIRKTIANVTSKILFVLFYSTTDDMLTSIPMIDGVLSSDEKYYGEQKLEELKIWTRRKR